MTGKAERPTAYEILAVHPQAPGELISAAYWITIEEIQLQRALGRPADDALHLVTTAYQKVSIPDVRAGYNLSIGDTTEPLTTAALSSKRWPFGSGQTHVDYYEVMGLHETAPQELVAEAYRTMRALYLRVPVSDKRRRTLLTLLEHARATLSDEGKRARYEQTRAISREREAALEASREAREPVLRRLLRVVGGLLPVRRHAQRPSHQQTMFGRLSLYVEAMQSEREGS